MYYEVKVQKSSWKAFVKKHTGTKVRDLDKIFKQTVDSMPIHYKAPKKMTLGKPVTSEITGITSIAKIEKVSTNIFSKDYKVLIFVNENCVPGKVIKANIEKDTARLIFELWYCTISNKLYINAFALVDKDNQKATTKIIKIKH